MSADICVQSIGGIYPIPPGNLLKICLDRRLCNNLPGQAEGLRISARLQPGLFPVRNPLQRLSAVETKGIDHQIDNFFLRLIKFGKPLPENSKAVILNGIVFKILEQIVDILINRPVYPGLAILLEKGVPTSTR